jgi:FlaA1/EpsC-like NDP-sugar epimerase
MKILITGASGSIGSELVEQLIQDETNEIICFDRNEEKVFYLEKQIRLKYPNNKFTVCLGDVTNVARLRQVFAEYKPQVVYHTAANKHVPLGEDNVHEFVHNNILGTINLAHVAVNYCDTFVFISTDKAVEPASVMGYTKRMCEKYLLGISNRYNTKFIICRFGNIVGSSGSVYEIFEKQAKTGLIQVTDKDMERYFITPKAAITNLIKCSTLEQGMYTFDMGDPVSIYRIAEEFAIKYGASIEFTGIRPGEKIKEKLKYDYEQLELVEKDIFKITSLVPNKEMLDIYLLVHTTTESTKEELIKTFKKINNEWN